MPGPQNQFKDNLGNLSQNKKVKRGLGILLSGHVLAYHV